MCLSHFINYHDDINYPDDDDDDDVEDGDDKSRLNMLVNNSMSQNVFCACAIVGFVT
jgi:hypothetical protein